MKLSKHNWKEYSEHKIAVMPPYVSEHILSRVAPVFPPAPLTVPVMAEVNGVEVQQEFPHDYPVVALRGRPMVEYNVDYAGILPVGEAYPGSPETRAIVATVYQKAASGPMLKRETYEVQSKTWTGYVLDDM